MSKRYVVPEERLTIIAPHSEVCMHMQVAGKPMLAMLLPSRNAAQLFTLDGREFSAPVTPGEAGFYQDADGFYLSHNGPCMRAGDCCSWLCRDCEIIAQALDDQLAVSVC